MSKQKQNTDAKNKFALSCGDSFLYHIQHAYTQHMAAHFKKSVAICSIFLHEILNCQIENSYENILAKQPDEKLA